jgi:hypothetical protein
MVKNKVCCTCKKRRLVKFFHKLSSTKDGLAKRCKTCQKKKDHERYLREKDKINARTNAYNKAHRAKLNEAKRKWRVHEKATLSDAYVRNSLVEQGVPSGNITQAMINRKRKEIKLREKLRPINQFFRQWEGR